MKKLGLFIFILIATKSFAQNVFIPYTSGNKFGLCDETGKVMLTPKYDNVEYLEMDFFKYENYKIQYDTAKSLWGDIVL